MWIRKPTHFTCGWMIPKSSSRRKCRPGVVLDFDEHNQVVGIEMLHLSKRASKLDFRELQYQTT